MIDVIVVSLALAASLGYVWAYYRRRLRRTRKTDGDRGRNAGDCATGCSGCPRH